MRIAPNLPRLRVVALGCWAVGGWCIIYSAQLMPLLLLGVVLLGTLLLAVGLAFWALSADRRAGIVFDAKGILLNLGHSSAFISWQNIERVGVIRRRDSVFTIGSRRQIGIKLRDVEQYIQTYEERLPAARGAFAGALRLIDTALRPLRTIDDRALRGHLASCREQTGYDALIPEALLGGRAEAFAAILESYRIQPASRRVLAHSAWMA